MDDYAIQSVDQNQSSYVDLISDSIEKITNQNILQMKVL